ncbi:MAG: hypothetical protein QM709_03190 [Spongiibacteraceae bacterium]
MLTDLHRIGAIADELQPLYTVHLLRLIVLKLPMRHRLNQWVIFDCHW